MKETSRLTQIRSVTSRMKSSGSRYGAYATLSSWPSSSSLLFPSARRSSATKGVYAYARAVDKQRPVGSSWSPLHRGAAQGVPRPKPRRVDDVAVGGIAGHCDTELGSGIERPEGHDIVATDDHGRP